MEVFYAHTNDANENQLIGHADNATEARALATARGLSSSEATDTCDEFGSPTDADADRVWIVLP